MAIVLVYGFDIIQEQVIRQTAAKLGMNVRRVLPEEAKETVLRLLATPESGKPVPASGDASEHFLLAAPDSQEQMFDLFRRISEIGLNVPCKAMVTPTNLNWPFGELVRHVSEEAREMRERTERQKNAKQS